MTTSAASDQRAEARSLALSPSPQLCSPVRSAALSFARNLRNRDCNGASAISVLEDGTHEDLCVTLPLR